MLFLRTGTTVARRWFAECIRTSCPLVCSLRRRKQWQTGSPLYLQYSCGDHFHDRNSFVLYWMFLRFWLVVNEGRCSSEQVTLNRPHFRNAFGRITAYEVDRAFSTACEDDFVGVIVLCGAGDHFCSGHDLGTPEQVADIEAKPYQPGVRGDMKKWRDTDSEMCLKWRSLLLAGGEDEACRYIYNVCGG